MFLSSFGSLCRNDGASSIASNEWYHYVTTDISWAEMYSITTRSQSRLAASHPSAASSPLSLPPSLSSLSSLPSSDYSSQSNTLVTIPPNGRHEEALSQIEGLLESIVDSLAEGEELTIPYRTARYGNDPSSQLEDQQSNFVRFPGRSIQEAQRFEAIFRIIELSHEALLSGDLITKRNIYYQNINLYKTQGVVDDMVDNIAFTLGVGREDLNIVAAARGLISGPIALFMRGGETVQCGLPTENGLLLPSIHAVEKVQFNATKWLLIIEKEATFRTLAASQYPDACAAGPGILVTAKGFPDLATRRFLSILHSVRPELAMFALVDYDPHGIAIMRTYKTGSKRLEHEDNVTVPGVRWLGIRSGDVLAHKLGFEGMGSQTSSGESTQDFSSQESLDPLNDGSQDRRPSKRPRLRGRDSSQSLGLLTVGDRKKAVDVMKDIYDNGEADSCAREQFSELQKMLMLNIKAEIQAVDDFGDITHWLDGALSRE
ncbi:Spo11/DNA topoisomerase VI subunit A [Cercophora newfieldiana]|uniref:DNA topoisomerase (ATP-hydrolyzing) n=1 Tax=Cercophora newfieldiana TaxID=92897 RepID=A0AA40CVV6_9PEZI|nr:Spo11/DNA topoisomerase VI subunit A [Cercophora newfieldiana]